MTSRRPKAGGREIPRTPSPTDSLSSWSSSSTYVSTPSNSSPNLAVAVDKPLPPLPPMPASTTAPPRPRRPSPPQTLLGAIEENSGTVHPDVRLSSDKERNPVAKLHVYSAVVGSKKKPTLAAMRSRPVNEFDLLVGPNGERFADLRMNRKAEGKGMFKKLMCFG